MIRTEKEIIEELRQLRDQLPESATIEDLIEESKRQENEKMQQEPGRKQVGATIREDLWQRLRALAILEGRPTKGLLDDAIKAYLEKNEKR